MRISAEVCSSEGRHEVAVRTNDQEHPLQIAVRPGRPGSSVNGGELLLLALATCYCNDIFREAAKRGIDVGEVQVRVEGNFLSEGAASQDIRYHAKVAARATQEEIAALMAHTDRIAEVHTTLRRGASVTLATAEPISLLRAG